MKFFDPKERMRQKQAARDKDDADLRSGKVTREELQKRNSFTAGLDLRNAKVVIRNRGKI